MMSWRRLVVGIALLAQAAACAPAAAPPSAKPQAGAAPAPPAAPAQGAPAAAAPAPPRAPTKLVVGHFPATHTGGVYIAQERGYLAEQGIEADLTPFQSL